MLYLSLILHPATGGPLEKLGDLTIINDGTGTAEVGNYDVSLNMPGMEGTLRDRVEGFHRSRGAWQLVIEALTVLNE